MGVKGITPGKRPGTGVYATTPAADELRQLIGNGASYEGVTFSSDEFRNIRRMYGFKMEQPMVKPPPPKPPEKEEHYKNKNLVEWQNYRAAVEAHKNWKDGRVMMQAGADRNALRLAKIDGLRLMGWLARYIHLDEDPLKFLVRAVSEAGYDVDPSDYEWATTDEEAEKEDQ